MFFFLWADDASIITYDYLACFIIFLTESLNKIDWSTRFLNIVDHQRILINKIPKRKSSSNCGCEGLEDTVSFNYKCCGVSINLTDTT